MRAAQLTRLDGPDAVEVGEIDEPTGDGVIVDVHAAGAAFPDALLTRGLYQYRPDPPFVLGAEIAGVVRSAPDGGHGPAVQRSDHVLRADRAWTTARRRVGAGARRGRRHRHLDASAGEGARC